METTEPPVFFDPRGRRWRRVKRTWLSLAVIITTLAAIFVISVIINPLLPRLNLPSAKSLPHAKDLKLKLLPPAPREQKARRAEAELRRELQKANIVPGQKPAQMHIAPAPSAPSLPLAPTGSSPEAKSLAIGFYVNWDDSSYASLKRNLTHLDWVVPEWVRLKDGPDPIVRDIDPRALDLIRRERPSTLILPLVQNYQNEEWNSELLARAVGDEQARQRLIASLTQLVAENNFAGVCIDLEEVPPASQAALYSFMQELHAAFRARGLVVAQAVPFDNPDWNYRAYAATTDYLLLMAYDQHWATSRPGAISAQDWFEQTLRRRMAELDPLHTIICVGNYGYDWSDASEEAPEVSFQETVLAARDSEASIKFDPATRNPYFTYDEEDGSHHTIWFLDAVTAYNQMRAASSYHPAGFALWRLGSEDPSLWSVFGSSLQPAIAPADELHLIRYGYDIDFEGTGGRYR